MTVYSPDYVDLSPLEDDTAIRIEQIGWYKYSIVYKYVTDSYYVHCVDTERPNKNMDHGPYSLEKCHAMLDQRIAFAEEKKR